MAVVNVVSWFMSGFEAVFAFELFRTVLASCMLLAFVICLVEWCFKVF